MWQIHQLPWQPVEFTVFDVVVTYVECCLGKVPFLQGRQPWKSFVFAVYCGTSAHTHFFVDWWSISELIIQANLLYKFEVIVILSAWQHQFTILTFAKSKMAIITIAKPYSMLFHQIVTVPNSTQARSAITAVCCFFLQF